MIKLRWLLKDPVYFIVDEEATAKCPTPYDSEDPKTWPMLKCIPKPEFPSTTPAEGQPKTR